MSSALRTRDTIAAGLKRRHAAEWRFRLFGLAAISVGLAFLVVLFVSITTRGSTAFKQTFIAVNVHFDAKTVDPRGTNDPAVLAKADYRGLLKRGLTAAFPGVKGRREKRELFRLVSSGAPFEVRAALLADPGLVDQTATIWVTASDDVDMIMKGTVDRSLDTRARRLSDRQMRMLNRLETAGHVQTRFNERFFTQGDSREPELAGIAVAVVGSVFSVLVCIALSFPLGVMAALYLEEFAPRNRWTGFLEVNINNLAAVPSIVFGLLGLAVFLNFFGLPRSAPLVGGMVLALMTLPTIIIAGRAALKAVPPSIREAALAVGASPIQAVFHHVLPLAMPGVLTGTIIGTARALGETAPLMMVGMVAFIVDIPDSILSAATALPVQVFLWADHPERAFLERTSAAVLVLLVFTCLMNLLAVFLRRKFEVRW